MLFDPQISQLIDHLFRHEYGKLVSVLTGFFGTEHLDLAEDVVQDSLLAAMSDWTYNGVPRNPSAWLYKVAKNKALNVVKREKYKKQHIAYTTHHTPSETTDINFFSEEHIEDDQLRMMFTCCHPAISPDSQVALTLKTLCGFGIPEIASAFLTTEDNINKRLVRARQKIRHAKIPFQVPSADELDKRSEAVLEALYLLFNEGYSASSGDDLIRHELCAEAIRLAEILARHSSFKDKSSVYALLALMLLNASRFEARQDAEGNILQMAEQDRTKWDRGLQQKGFYYLQLSTTDQVISMYHILAGISAHHCAAQQFQLTNWKSILSLYDKLLKIDPSPVILLNRAIAVSKVSGPAAAIEELEKIESYPSFKNHYLFYATKAELLMQSDLLEKAAEYFERAVQFSPLAKEKALLRKKLAKCRQWVK